MFPHIVGQVYAIGYPTTDGPTKFPFRTAAIQTSIIELFDLVNNLSYRLHKYREWGTDDLNLLEKDLAQVLVMWEGINDIATEYGYAKTLVAWGKKEKVGALNTLVSTMENFGALRFLSSAVGEKAHQMPKHCLELSKGKNRAANSLKQAMRIEYSSLRGVYSQIQKKIVDDAAERSRRADGAVLADTGGRRVTANSVSFRGPRTFEDALPDVEDGVVARICHLIREVVEAQIDTTGEVAIADLTALERIIPAQPSTPAG